MNLSDSGRVAARKGAYGKNPNIEILMETQIEKWAFYRENVHRNFNYSKPSNYRRGFIYLVLIPVGFMAFIFVGQVSRDSPKNVA